MGVYWGWWKSQSQSRWWPEGDVWFIGTGIILHLGVQADFIPARKAHPAFLVADLDNLQKKLEAAEVPIAFDEALLHIPRFHAFDPFGNRLEFIQDGLGFSQQPD